MAFRISDLGFQVSGFGFRVSGFKFQVFAIGFRVSGSGIRVSGSGFQVSGFRSRAARRSSWKMADLEGCSKVLHELEVLAQRSSPWYYMSVWDLEASNSSSFPHPVLSSEF